MSDIITNVRSISKDHWMKESDGLWYTHIPFECTEDEDIIINLVDPSEYINEHKADFDALGNGYTKKNECVVTSLRKPECDITVELKKAYTVPGRIIYTKDEKGQFVAEFEPAPVPQDSAAGASILNALGSLSNGGLGSLGSMLGGLAGGLPDLPAVDETVEEVPSEDTSEESTNE